MSSVAPDRDIPSTYTNRQSWTSSPWFFVGCGVVLCVILFLAYSQYKSMSATSTTVGSSAAPQQQMDMAMMREHFMREGMRAAEMQQMQKMAAATGHSNPHDPYFQQLKNDPRGLGNSSASGGIPPQGGMGGTVDLSDRLAEYQPRTGGDQVAMAHAGMSAQQVQGMHQSAQGPPPQMGGGGFGIMGMDTGLSNGAGGSMGSGAMPLGSLFNQPMDP